MLLEQAGYVFHVQPPHPQAECGICTRETPPETAARLARQKAADVAGNAAAAGIDPGALIVACDTLVECVGQVPGKPRDRAHARTMLELLSGREHHVYSGLCIWPQDGRQPRVEVARTTLRMDPLDEAQISEYLDSGQWEGKAGAFGYQDRVGWLHIVDGSESNVIGLPLELLAALLAQV